MPLVNDFLEVLQHTWGSWSLSTKFAFKKLTSKKHLPENNSVQNKTAEVPRGGDSTEATEAVTQSLVNPTLQTSLQERKSRSYYLDEVALHNKRNDCWIVIKDKVRSSFISASTSLQLPVWFWIGVGCSLLSTWCTNVFLWALFGAPWREFWRLVSEVNMIVLHDCVRYTMWASLQSNILEGRLFTLMLVEMAQTSSLHSTHLQHGRSSRTFILETLK